MDPETKNPTPSGAPEPNQSPAPATNGASWSVPSQPAAPAEAAGQPVPAPSSTPVPPAPIPTPPSGAPGSTAPTFSLTGQTPPEESAPEPKDTLGDVANGFKAVLGAIFSWIIFPVAVVLILHNFVFQAYHVVGTSMVPTLHETDYLIISKVGNTASLIQRTFGSNTQYIPPRGQVIVFHFPKNPTQIFVKRVIGEPGDRVVVKGGNVTVYNKDNPDGFNPDTKYEKSDTVTLEDTDEIVQPGNIFVLGDNRTPNGSYDSREWGQLPSSYIIGNAVLRLLPLDQVRIF